MWERKEFLNERSEFRNSGEGSEPFANLKPLTRICSSLCSHNCVLSHKGRGKVIDKKAAFTLAEGATHVDMFDNIRRAAFTLAEVLITIAIIGIVAAMTIPTLISKYQKREFGTRLAQTYSTLSNAVKMAQVEYGDVSRWGYQSLYGSSVDTSNWLDAQKEYTVNFTEKFFLPYLRVAKNYGFVQSKDAGYPEYTTKDGRIYFSNYTSRYIVELNNGITLFFAYNGGRDSNDETKFVFSTPIIFVDVNAKKGPNVLGRDLFMFQVSAIQNKLVPYGYEKSRSVLYDLCRENPAGSIYDALACAALIQLDGWKITDDYPW